MGGMVVGVIQRVCAGGVLVGILLVCVVVRTANADSAQVTQVVFISSDQAVQIDTSSSVMTTQTRNATGTLEQVSAGTVLQYTSTSATGQFSNANSSGCTGTFSGVPFTLTMSTGSANKNFCYRDSTAGTYTLTVSAQGQSWTAATQIVTITGLPDTTAPVIAAHADITGVEATSSAGAVVSYTPPDATDNVDAVVPAVCAPVSGATFALGTSIVTCGKSDTAGNSATSTTFSVTVVDTIPDAFSFVDQGGVADMQEVVSNVIVVSGVSTSTSISVIGGEYSVNGGGYTASAGTVSNGDSVAVRHTSASSNGGTVETMLTIGGVGDIFSSTVAVRNGGGGSTPHRRMSVVAEVPVETAPSVEETLAAIAPVPADTAVDAHISALQQEILSLMHALVFSLQARLGDR